MNCRIKYLEIIGLTIAVYLQKMFASNYRNQKMYQMFIPNSLNKIDFYSSHVINVTDLMDVAQCFCM